MPENERINRDGQISRRQFIKGAGIVVGSTAVGSSVLLGACGGEESTKTVTVTKAVDKYVCPVDNMQFDTLAALQAHFESEHAATGLNTIALNVNGKEYITEVKPYWSLTFVLREKLGLYGVKQGCGVGECGSCTVIMDGRSVYSCMVLAIECQGHQIKTVEGLSDGITLSSLQQAIVDNSAAQCGFCTPGFIMSARAFLDDNSNPTMDEVREALSGHVCMCGELKTIVDAVHGLGG